MPIKLKGLSAEQAAAAFPFTTILAGYRGSIAHNMYIPNTDPHSVDDKDVMGVTIAPAPYYFGLDRFDHKETQIGEYDVVVYELRKFVRLLYKSNPNVLSLLWLRPNHYLKIADAGQVLIDNRQLFATKAIYRSFVGYAHGQMKRMTAFQKQGYMGEKRKALVEKFGFDPKNAGHLIRLLRMGVEFLNEGELHVWRDDAPQLLEIKTGKWTLEQVKTEAERLFKRADDAYDRSALPNKPDYKKVSGLLGGILGAYFKVGIRDGL